MFLKKKHKTKTVQKKQSSHSKKNREKKKIRHKSSAKGNKKKRVSKSSPKSKKKHKKTTKRKIKKIPSLVKDIFFATIVTLLVSLLIGIYFVSINQVKGSSMSPTMKNGNWILVSKKATIRRFDVIAFKEGKDISFRRVIGLPDENIKYADDYLTVNGQPVDEKFLVDQINEAGKSGQVYTQSASAENGFQIDKIPKDSYLVLGDNRPNSTDSRQYGLISKNQIKGKSSLILSPFGRVDE
ncbi:signal peptidase I [Vagococcus carniphilus]|nr:signal peptidase I [Vagococcus carniphilus]